MVKDIMFYLSTALLLVFGVCLSLAFSGVDRNRKNLLLAILLCSVCGALQIGTLLLGGEELATSLYPLTTHAVIVVFSCTVFKKKAVTVISAVALAYLDCQVPNWLGIATQAATDSAVWGYAVQAAATIVFGYFCLRFFASPFSEMYSKDGWSALMLSSAPIVYYAFDYITGVYTDLWSGKDTLIAETLPLMLCIFYTAFSVIYVNESRKKEDAKKREQAVRICLDKQERELEAQKKSLVSTRILRHDMRHFLSTVAVSLEAGDTASALELISKFISLTENAAPQSFCQNEMINYTVSDFVARCKERGICFEVNISPSIELPPSKSDEDEILLVSVVSNALENAINAQAPVKEGAYVRLMMKSSDEKLLISVENPCESAPEFTDGIPVSENDGHGFGAQSIRYAVERLGGKCLFCVEDTRFILRIII